MEDQNIDKPVIQNSSEIIEPKASFSWEASEYVAHDKSGTWYLLLWAAVAVLCGVLGLLHQWLSIAVVVVMALAVVVYSRKEPRVLAYALDDKGISINGRLLPYNLYRSYSVLPEVAWREIDLEPAQRFSPRLTLLCEENDFETIEEIFSQHLPRVDRTPDVIERLSRYLKF